MLITDPTRVGMRLPVRVGDRILLGVVAVPVATLAGLGFAAILTAPAEELRLLTRLIASELVGLIFVVAALALIWAVAAPAWIEQSLHHVAVGVTVLVTGTALVGVVWGTYVLFRYW